MYKYNNIILVFYSLYTFSSKQRNCVKKHSLTQSINKNKKTKKNETKNETKNKQMQSQPNTKMDNFNTEIVQIRPSNILPTDLEEYIVKGLEKSEINKINKRFKNIIRGHIHINISDLGLSLQNGFEWNNSIRWILKKEDIVFVLEKQHDSESIHIYCGQSNTKKVLWLISQNNSSSYVLK